MNNTHPTPSINGSSNSPIFHSRNKILHQVNILTNTSGEHSTATGKEEFLSFLPQPVLIRFLLVNPVIRHVPEANIHI